MFLMKSPPLVALQRKWEPFAPSRTCRYPVCFSESEDDIARTAVSAKVQVIINNLQSDESSLGAGDEYGCIVQKKQKGAKGRGQKLLDSGRVLQEHVSYGQRHCPADSDGMEVEESSEFGPLSVNSDSDDSVDRDIEEAIQEYLRNKSRDVQHLPSNAESMHSTNGGKRLQLECPSREATCNIFPANVEADVVPQLLAPDYLGDEAAQQAASPCSASSDDSFEQSIQAEIEQFLNKKQQQQQARKTHLAGEGKRLDQKEAPETVALRSQKEGTKSANRMSLKRGCKAALPRPLPALQSGGAPRKCLQPVFPKELADFKKTSQAHPKTAVTGHSCMPEQSKEGKIRHTLWETPKDPNAEVSDSSSDDGIEEAIQLYQLEKIKKEANSQTGRHVFQKATFQSEGVADISASLTIRSMKTALAAAPRKAPQPMELSRHGEACSAPKKGRRCAPAATRFASCSVAFQASCRVDTAAELMCAEAILDISKTILPPPAGSDHKSLATDPFDTQRVPPSQQESDSNAVDSDDSIEQEIRAFLAVKAQAEVLTATSKGNRHPVQSLPSSGQPGDQSRSPKHSVCKTQLSLSRKKRLKRESKVSRQIQDKPEKLSSVGCSPEDHSKPCASQIQGAASIPQAGETGEVDGCRQQALSLANLTDFANPPSQGLRRTKGRVKTVTRAPQKYGADDKSSSLDSDEDLDTAIKDLLRSKRKRRKKSKDQRVQCKKRKRVRFQDKDLCVFEDILSGSQERDCKSRTAPLPKSCLTRSQRDIGGESTKSRRRTAAKGKPKSAKSFPLALECKKKSPPKSVSQPDNRDVGKTNPSPWTATSLKDDCSSVDSDDGIEQEIRKFLAAKAKDATSAAEVGRTAEPPGVAKPPIVFPNAKRRLLWTKDNPPSKRRKKVKEAGPPPAELRKNSSSLRCTRKSARNPPRTVAQVIDLGSQPPGKLQTHQRIGQADTPVKRSVGDHQVVPDGELAWRRLPGRKGVTGDCKLRNYAKPLSPFKRKNPHEFKISSKFIAGLKSAQGKKKSVPVGKKQSLMVSLLEREAGILPISVLSGRCAAAVQEGLPGSPGVSQADLPPAERGQPCVPEWPGKTQAPPLRNEALSLAATNPAGRSEFPSVAETDRDPPLQAPSTGGIRGAKVSPGPFPLAVPVEEEASRTPGHGASWEGWSAPSTPPGVPLKANALTSPDRLAERRAQEVLEGGSPEFIDSPVAEQAPGLAKNNPSSFYISTSIDPGWRVLPYIALSPAQLLASRTLAVQGRRRAMQVLGEKLGSGWNSRMTRLPEP